MSTAKERIQPPAYHPTEIEHKAAYYRYLLEYICDDVLLGIDMTNRGELKNTTVEKELEIIHKWFDKWQEKDNEEKELWECIQDFKEFKEHWGEALSGPHQGDCVYIACSCVRCWAEHYYSIPNSVTFDGREGWMLFNEAFPEGGGK